MVSHFRGIATGSVSLQGHSLLVGGNSVGKSTICEALDLVLGPERLARRPVVDEHDFHLGTYLEPDGTTPEIRIEVWLGDLSTEAQTRFINHVRRWSAAKNAFLDEPGGAEPDDAGDEWVLPLVFLARYDADEDDFVAGTFFAHPYSGADGGDEDRLGSGMRVFGREDKRFSGFLYLRPNRTGNRALSFERGSLLDTIIRLEASQSGPQWEGVLADLRELDAAPNDSRLGHIRSKVETQVGQFMTLGGAGRGVDIKGSEQTREHLRAVLRLFVRTQPGDHPVPFNRLSTGSLNVLVFAMLTYIAELKGESSVIFAIEEPEIALPPHGQRRLLQFAMSKMGQVIVTSHSPYIIERFEPESVIVVRREDGALTGSPVTDATALSLKKYRQNRRQFAEAVLASGVLVVEGATEASLIPVISDVMAAELGHAYDHIDIAGVSIFDASNDVSVPAYASVFKALGKHVFGVHDQVNQGLTSDQEAMTANFDLYLQLPVKSVEALLCAEVPAAVHRRFLQVAGSLSGYPRDCDHVTDEMDDPKVLELSRKVLSRKKGLAAGYARLLVEQCHTVAELPASLVGLLQDISDHLRPASTEEAAEANEDAAVDDGTSAN